MTLLMGKIFRPWDLSAEQQDSSSKSFDPWSPPGSSDLISPPPNFNHHHPFDFCDTNNESGSGGKSHSKGERRNKTQCGKSEKKKESQSYSDVNEAYWQRFQPELSHCMDPDNQSPLYLPHSAINNLANLSRSELTAMGLLPHDPPSSTKVKRQRPKRFHCPHCQVAFSNNGQLRGHVRIHTGEWTRNYEGFIY
jgi:hypothetical protein